MLDFRLSHKNEILVKWIPGRRGEHDPRKMNHRTPQENMIHEK
jgi:hypothetical protein